MSGNKEKASQAQENRKSRDWLGWAIGSGVLALMGQHFFSLATAAFAGYRYSKRNSKE